MKIKALLLLAVSCALLFASSAHAGVGGTFTTVLNQAQLRDGLYSGSPAFGRMSFTLDGRDNLLCYDVTVLNLEGVAIQVELFPGVDEASKGAPLRTLVGNPLLDCIGPLTLEEQRALADGEYSVGLSTDLYPEGEIGGQIVRLGDVPVYAPGDEQVGELNLNARQLVILEKLLRMSPEEFQRVAMEIQQNGVAYLEVDAAQAGGTALASGDVRQRIELSEDDITNISNAVAKAFNDALATLKNTATNTWNKVRTIGNTLNAELQLGDAFADIDDAFSKALQLLLALREGFDTFDANGFRNNMITFFSKMQIVADKTVGLLCVESLPTIDTDSAFLQTAVNLTPDVLLYVMSKAFSAVSPHWYDIPDTMLDPLNVIGNPCAEILPTVLQTEQEGNGKQALALPQMCDLDWFDSQEMYIAAISLRGGGMLAQLIFKGIAACVPKDTVIVAAGEGSTVYANPWRAGLTVLGELAKAASSAGDFLLTHMYRCRIQSKFDSIGQQFDGFDKSVVILDRRDIEMNLQRCYPVVSLMLPRENGGQLEDVDELIRDLVIKAQDAGLNTGEADRLLNKASKLAGNPKGDYRRVYDTYCDAYKKIVTEKDRRR